MNQCSLCMTENHEQATVCKACGAVKMLVRERPGILRGLAIMGFGIVGLFLLMGGKYLVGLGLMGFGLFIGSSTPRKLMWVKSTLG
jgi:hypothetical protein